jgi:nucleotide-binding universal stress UspA family protein
VEASRALAQGAVDRLKPLQPRWKIDATAAGDSPAWAIIRKADEWRADLIVLGSHGRSVLERLLLGSVSQKVAAEAHCSVRIARTRAHSHPSRLRVLVAVDGSADSRAAVDAVAGRVWPSDTEFRVVTAIDPSLETSVAWSSGESRQWVQSRDETPRDWVCRLVENAAQQIYSAGLNVDTQVLNGDPKHLLVKAAETWAADAIFVGARGLQHGNRLMLGSVASAVTTRAHCSVEIVRPPR